LEIQLAAERLEWGKLSVLPFGLWHSGGPARQLDQEAPFQVWLIVARWKCESHVARTAVLKEYGSLDFYVKKKI